MGPHDNLWQPREGAGRRVLAAGGKVGGFSAPGGAAAKIRMLELEGVDVRAFTPAQGAFGF